MSLPVQLQTSTPVTNPSGIGSEPQSEATPVLEGEAGDFLAILVTRLSTDNGDLPPLIDGEELLPGLPVAEDEGNILPVAALPVAITIPEKMLVEPGARTTLVKEPLTTSGVPLQLQAAPLTPHTARPELPFQPEGLLPDIDGEPESLQTVLRLPQAVMATAGKKESPDLLPGVTVQMLPALAAGTSSSNSASVVSTPSLLLSAQINTPQWQNSLGERMVWMVKRDLQQAELRLNPQHLGPVEVRIEVRNEQASVTFSAHHAMTRDALESAIPRLREMLGDSGLTLANVDVSQQQPGHGQQQEDRTSRQGDHIAQDGMENHGTEESLISSGVAVGGSGLIDIFA